MIQTRSDIIAEFLQTAGWKTAKSTPVTGDASARRYTRLSHPFGTAILMDAPPEQGETIDPFIQIASHLCKIGLSAPRILAQDSAAGLLLIEDFGDALYCDLMTRDLSAEVPLYRAAADVLIHLQAADPMPRLVECDARWLVDMVAPFFEYYLKDKALCSDFNTCFLPFANQLDHDPKVMILRDYHAQNLLDLPDRDGVAAVGVLDFQDALLGHAAYDLVSILQDARRDVSAQTEAEILSYFLQNSRQETTNFKRSYAILGVQRNLRILGIFARLNERDGKPEYLAHIPRVWGYIQRNLAHPDLTVLRDLLADHLPKPNDAFLAQLKNRGSK